jgi:hypothetical protein
MPFVQHDDVIQAFTADTANEPFQVWIVPTGVMTGGFLMQANPQSYPGELLQYPPNSSSAPLVTRWVHVCWSPPVCSSSTHSPGGACDALADSRPCWGRAG